MKLQKNPSPREPKKAPSEKTKKEMLIIVALSLAFMFFYFAAAYIPVPYVSFIVMILYMLALAGFAVAYIAYNYAFTRKDVTTDMLPDDWSDEKKHEFIQKGKDRAQKSRWMIFVIFPLIVTFMADVLYLFIWEGWLKGFFINLIK